MPGTDLRQVTLAPGLGAKSHNLKVVSSNLTPATKKAFLSATSANPATIRIDNYNFQEYAGE